MKVQVIYTSASEKILLQVLEKLNENDVIPEPGIYHIFFEKVEEQKVPEFNQ